MLLATTLNGPGSIIVSNSNVGSYSAKSAAVSVPLGQRIIVTDEIQSGKTIEGGRVGILDPDHNQPVQRARLDVGESGRAES